MNVPTHEPKFSNEYGVCPYCGCEHGDLGEMKSDSFEIDCSDCGKRFSVDADWSVVYRSYVPR